MTSRGGVSKILWRRGGGGGVKNVWNYLWITPHIEVVIQQQIIIELKTNKWWFFACHNQTL